MFTAFSVALLLTALHGAVAISSAGCGRSPTLTSGAHSLTVNGQEREYILDVPPNYDPRNPYRLVFGFHWNTGTMEDVATGQTVEEGVWAYYGLKRLDVNNSVIFVAPQGIDNGWANVDDRDTQFVDAMISTLETDLCIDTRLRFATGFSYGGSMSYSLACSRADVFRAVAALSGAQLSGCEGGQDPVPYLGIHGISDPLLNISLGRELRDRFVRNNGCTPQDASEPANGTLTHIKTVYEGCKAGYPVWWIAYDGGHMSAPEDGSYKDSGTNSFPPPETWAFFSQFS